MKQYFNFKTILLTCFVSLTHLFMLAGNYNNNMVSVWIKLPGNKAVEHKLLYNNINSNNQQMVSKNNDFPLTINRKIVTVNGNQRVVVNIKAINNTYFNYTELLKTGFGHNNCQFYMPGFWYRQNLRSPQQAPSFHTSDSWTVREDRLSAPLTGVFDTPTGNYVTVLRIDKFENEALTTHNFGEVILSGKTSLGYTGFENIDQKAAVSFGFPYFESPKTYVRKLTLAPAVRAFQYLPKGDSITLVWEITSSKASDFSEFVASVWNYSYNTLSPKIVETPYTPELMKSGLANFFTSSFVSSHQLKYMSGVHMQTNLCNNTGIAEVGFVGRVLLNAFNALEYGHQNNMPNLVQNSYQVFSSYLQHGFTKNGFFREVCNFDNNTEENNLSIRRQSEGVYAMLYFLQYEKNNGRNHPEWEAKLINILNQFVKLQRADGSFPRKFTDNLNIIDSSGGSTPCATVPLVLAHKYFKNKTYMACAKKTATYLDNQIISKADYFSSTLDANCEDKEASYYASTALYYLAMFTKGNEHKYYAGLAHKSAYFALSWYYLWDVPFAKGQMLGDVNLKTRGWGNVSVENNHIDVFVFGFNTVLYWLANEFNEPQLSNFAKVIETSMCQLLPTQNQLFDIGKPGFYPEVVQHTNWDYGRNGKGFYNDIFAPGWTVASLWELLTPQRINLFLKK